MFAMDMRKLQIVLQALIFIVPVNIYVIGDWLGSGVQFLLFRFQQVFWDSQMVDVWITIIREVTLIFNGTITGRSAIAIGSWTAGVLILIAALLLAIFAWIGDDDRYIRHASLLTAAGGVALLLADIIQYGILLHGPAGFVIPIGIPVILIIAYLAYQNSAGGPEPDEEETLPEETD